MNMRNNYSDRKYVEINQCCDFILVENHTVEIFSSKNNEGAMKSVLYLNSVELKHIINSLDIDYIKSVKEDDLLPF